MTIVGVTNESASRIEPFITDKGIKYLIALGGGGGYKYPGIPHAWLVDPKGKIVWDGHPASLKGTMIEEQLARVRLYPEFDLPKGLKRAQGYLAKGNFAYGLKALESYVKRPKDDEVASIAKKTIREVKKWGKGKYQDALDLGKEGDYGEGLLVLMQLEKQFKGREIGDKAKQTKSEWKKDKTIKTEIAAATALQKARSLISKKKYPAAGNLLKAIIKSKRFKETKTRVRAQKELQAIRAKL